MPPYARPTLPAAAALLANVASASAWVDCACFSWHATTLPCRRRVGASASLLGTSPLQRRPPRATTGDPRWGGQRRCLSLAAHQRLDVGGVVESVRKSLRYDLIQPHLDNLRSGDATETGDIPTIVLVLAVSGGCDSIALFHTVLALTSPHQKQREGAADGNSPPLWLYLGNNDATEQCEDVRVPCEVHVAHFNHEQRGESSDGDEAFVRELCEENEIPFHCLSWSEEGSVLGEPEDATVRQSANDNFTQDTARKWRRRELEYLLSHLAASQGSRDGRWGAILTAHHRDDADETILLKLLRGSHLTNIRGMEARGGAFELQRRGDGSIQADAHQSSSVGYFVKPMLDVRKHDIVEYLQSNSLAWREDESNASSKYRRNKVRNELMPLLREIAGGEHALQIRLGNLEQQSQDVSQYLSKQAEEYLQKMLSRSAFLLQSYQFDIVQEEALHMWLKNTTDGELHLPYDQMLRIREQLQNYPERLQWTLDVGSSWKLRRNGNALTVTRENTMPHAGAEKAETLPWTIVCSETAENISDIHALHFSATSIAEDDLGIKRVKDCGNVRFTPPWRKGRSAMKVKEFLRGQKIPLHRRDGAHVLCSSGDTSGYALAVYLEDTDDKGAGRWIVNADFSPQDDDSPQTVVIVGKTSSRT